MAHAMLTRLRVGSPLWSVSRGLARRVGDYKRLLEEADQPRQGDLNGRGGLSEQRLAGFVQFFLEACQDQVRYMEGVLDSGQLLKRIEAYVDEEVRGGRLPAGAVPVLREVLLAGEVSRGEAARASGWKERQGREVLATLLRRDLLKSDGPRSPVRLGFPVDAAERWFPLLFPAG